MGRQKKIDALMKAFLQLKRSMNKQMVEADTCTATPVQTEILAIISGKNSLRAADIAKSMNTSPSAITQHINQLTESGFVKKYESEDDKRQTLLSLTVAGMHVIKTKQELMRTRVERLVDSLSNAEIDEFIKISKKIAESSK